MARATRSTTTHEKDKPADSPPASRKGASKKRKRTSNADNDDTLPVKHPRTDSKDDTSPGPEEGHTEKKPDELPSSGDVPIQSADATDILDVLELCVILFSPFLFTFLTCPPPFLLQGRQAGSSRPRFPFTRRLRCGH